MYVSEPLKEPLTIAGPVSATLYAASSACDTDWFVRLMEVDEDGEIFVLVEGRLRARYHESTYEPKLLTPGEIYEFHLDMWHTGITFPAGSRVRVEVASASFPVLLAQPEHRRPQRNGNGIRAGEANDLSRTPSIRRTYCYP